MVDSHQMQHRGVQVVNVDALLDGVHPEFVGGAMSRAAPAHRNGIVQPQPALDRPRVARVTLETMLDQHRTNLPFKQIRFVRSR